MFNSKAILIGLCLLCATGPLLAQDCHLALRGHVTDADTKEALPYATVFVRETGKGAVTDENGWFAIPDLCERTPYTVEIHHVECAHFTQVVQLTENAEMEFHLVHTAILNEVVIREKAVAPPPTQAEIAVEQNDLEAAKGLNLGETLKKLPGVTLLSSGATIAKPVIQGLHSNRIAIVADGVTLQSQQWGNDHAPEIDPFTADKISVVKGAAGVRYGAGAMAGAVVLEPAPLREKDGIGGWLSLGGFSNGWGGVASGAADWHLPGRSLTFRLQGTAKRSGNLRAPDYWLGNTGASELNFSAMAGWKKGRWRHTVSVTQFGQRFGILRAAHTGSLSDLEAAISSDTPRNNLNYFSYKIDRPYQRVQHNVLKYKAEFRFNDIWKLSGQYNFQYNQRREYDRGRNNTTQGDKAQVAFQLWSNTLDLALEHLPIRHWQGGVGVQAVQQLNYVSKGGYIPDYLGWGGSVWATERWRRFPVPWEFEIGARYDFRRNHVTTTGNGNNDLDEQLTFGNVSGTLGAIYHFSNDFSAKLNTGLAWRPPHVNELFARGVHHGAGTYEQGNPDLESEKAWNSNLTLDWKTSFASAMVTVYRNSVQDFIYLNQPRDSIVLTVRGPFPAYFYQQDDAVLQGLDASVSVSFIPQLALETRASILRGYRLARRNGENSTYHDWLPLMPADRFQYGIRWTVDGRRRKVDGGRRSADGEREAEGETFVRLLATTVVRQSHIPEEGLTKAPPPAFTTLGLEAAHTFYLSSPSGDLPIEIGLNVQNLTNVRYREYLDFFRFYTDSPGVNVGLRAKVSFGH
ncbi:MAG: Vitamin B12 transporter BtuB [Saprospiraceae bacterium]|nr:Vitamin B12 transporter BtuB [Saprospiraceae bacterium]